MMENFAVIIVHIDDVVPLGASADGVMANFGSQSLDTDMERLFIQCGHRHSLPIEIERW